MRRMMRPVKHHDSGVSGGGDGNLGADGGIPSGSRTGAREECSEEATAGGHGRAPAASTGWLRRLAA